MAYGGQGVARVDNFVVFVENGYPGDMADIVIRKIKGNYAESQIVTIEEPSPNRIPAVCEHFGICGGCRWQNLDYKIQLQYKESQVKESLGHIANFQNPPVERIIPADPLFYYRNKMEYSFHIDRDDKLLLGLHVGGKYQDIFQLNKCHLQSEISNEIVRFVREKAIELGLPPYHVVTHEGFLRFLVVREAKFTGEFLVNFVTGSAQYEGLESLASMLTEKFSQIKSVSHTVNSEKANIARGAFKSVLRGGEFIYEKLGSKKYRISANSFFQTNSFQAKKLYDLAIELGQPQKSETMLDLYTGTGSIAIYFSDHVRSVTGIEIVQSAIDDATANAEINGASNCRFVLASVENYFKENAESQAIDLMVLDPPRAGCHPHAIKGILKIKPQKIIYISCNPTTLARDLKGLCENDYQLDKIIPVDLFPHTFHIESISRLSLK